MSLIQDIFSTRDAFISITYLIYHNFILVKQQAEKERNSSQVAATASSDDDVVHFHFHFHFFHQQHSRVYLEMKKMRKTYEWMDGDMLKCSCLFATTFIQ